MASRSCFPCSVLYSDGRMGDRLVGVSHCRGLDPPAAYCGRNFLDRTSVPRRALDLNGRPMKMTTKRKSKVEVFALAAGEWMA
jgi:hypothetical protein